jgi:hypothetical protein
MRRLEADRAPVEADPYEDHKCHFLMGLHRKSYVSLGAVMACRNSAAATNDGSENERSEARSCDINDPI